MFINAVYAGYKTLSTGQNGGPYAGDIYSSFSPVNTCVQIQLPIVYYSPIEKKSALV